MFAVGKTYRADYPRHNLHGARSETEVRRFRVLHIRDPAADPLDPATLAMHPLVVRAGQLLTVLDLDKGEERHFWSGRLTNAQEIEALPIGPHEVVLIDEDSTPEPVYRAGCADEAIAWLRRWLRSPLGLTVGIVPPRAAA